MGGDENMGLARLCLCVCMLGVDSTEELRSLIARHQQYLDSIKSLEVDVNAEYSEDGGRTWKSIATVTWRKQGTRHRFIRELFIGNIGEVYEKKGDIAAKVGSEDERLRHEVCFDADEFRELQMPEPPLGEPLSPKTGMVE